MNPAENYILNQREPYRSNLRYLQARLELTVPEPDRIYKYKIPFNYRIGKLCCYVKQAKNYVDLAFWDGNSISCHQEDLVTAIGKNILIKHKCFKQGIIMN